MAGSSAPSPKGNPLFALNRRRHPRLAQECLQSSLGPILDMSRGGARILCRQVPEEESVDMTIDDGLGDDPLEVRAKIVRHDRIGWRKHAVGVEFVDLDDARTMRLNQMSATGRFFQPD